MDEDTLYIANVKLRSGDVSQALLVYDKGGWIAYPSKYNGDVGVIQAVKDAKNASKDIGELKVMIKNFYPTWVADFKRQRSEKNSNS